MIRQNRARNFDAVIEMETTSSADEVTNSKNSTRSGWWIPSDENQVDSISSSRSQADIEVNGEMLTNEQAFERFLEMTESSGNVHRTNLQILNLVSSTAANSP